MGSCFANCDSPRLLDVLYEAGDNRKDERLIPRHLIIPALRSAWRGVVGAVFALFVASAPALSEELPTDPAALAGNPVAIPGADTPAFTEALALWLADDEEPALRAFSALAQQGNRAAQILLGLIDKSPPLQGPWLASVSRNDRIALMRAPEGLSGQSWLAAAADHPLAANWLALLSVDAGLPVALRFSELGEARAAREALVVLAAREHSDLRTADPEPLDPELTYLLWRTADPERRAMLLAHVPPGHPQRPMMGEERDPAGIAHWLEHAPAALGVAALCDARCPDSRATCRAAAYRALSSHMAVLVLGSPVEALVSQEEFLRSPRGQGAVLRRMLHSTDARGRGAMISQMRTQDACLADVLSQERARYHYRRPGVENGSSGHSD